MAKEFTVEVVEIKEVLTHPNAERLELAQIAGWQCVIQKGTYKAGDLAVYIPVDSVLPDAVERALFGPDSKIKLHKSRVRSIKIRGSISQGMLASCDDLEVSCELGLDVTKKLGITKYEPVTPSHLGGGNATKKKHKKNPFFKEYGGLDNYKWYNDLFKEGEQVVVTEKIHGTNFRFGWVRAVADTPLKRIKKLFNTLPEYEFVFGSNRVQLQNRASSTSKWKVKLLSWIPIKAVRTIAYQGYYAQSGVGNVYEEAVVKYDLKNRTASCLGVVLYAEIYGSSIQKNYTYGCAEGERKMVVFDALDTEPLDVNDDGFNEPRYFSQTTLNLLCTIVGLDTVPVLFTGPFSGAAVKALSLGDSVLAPSQKIREGVVIRPMQEEKCHIGRKLLKLISDDYAARDDNTDFH